LGNKAILLLILPLLACVKPRAGGDSREIVVFADDEAWAAAETTLVKALEREVTILDEESVFWVHHLPFDEFHRAKRRPSLLFLAAADESGPVGEAIATIVGEELLVSAKERPFMKLSDPWARGQMAFVIVGSTGPEVRDLASGAARRLYDGYLAHYEDHVTKRLYCRGPDIERSNLLREEFGWSIEVPKPWQMIESPDERWVHFVKTQPDRHVFVYWEDWQDSTFTAEHCLRLRKELVWDHYDEDEVDDERTFFVWDEFLGRKALEIKGAWINLKHTAGGPFRSICFFDDEQKRLYMLDLTAFAPDRPKFYVMTQLGIVAETFRVGDELGPFESGDW